jgi:hypothetical protein
MAFKMKGSPMKRNFGVVSPMNKNKGDQPKKMTPKTIAEQRPDDVDPKYPSNPRGEAGTVEGVLRQATSGRYGKKGYYDALDKKEKGKGSVGGARGLHIKSYAEQRNK